MLLDILVNHILIPVLSVFPSITLPPEVINTIESILDFILPLSEVLPLGAMFQVLVFIFSFEFVIFLFKLVLTLIRLLPTT